MGIRTHASALLLLGIFSVHAFAAPTAEQIYARHVAAIGGQKKLDAITSLIFAIPRLLNAGFRHREAARRGRGEPSFDKLRMRHLGLILMVSLTNHDLLRGKFAVRNDDWTSFLTNCYT